MRSLPDIGNDGQGHGPSGSVVALTVAALGIVYGDIGTSPLYTMRECAIAQGGHLGRTELLGVLSLVFWALTMVVTVKYLSFITRADNRGEGGIFALLALVPEKLRAPRPGGRIALVALLVLVGASLLYGEGIMTPAISVLSAIEGLEVATDKLEDAVVPLTCIILIGIFSIQKRGTGSVGALFGPVMLVWFFTLAGLGTYHIVKNPVVLQAVSPLHAVHFFAADPKHAFVLLGSVVLAITGCEALYADLGHFGRRPIVMGWSLIAMPALLLNYFGQGALLLNEPNLEHPFYALVPRGPFTYALVALATMATIIASQALISGAYSLTHQAVQLGYFPRVTVKHTSHHAEGQIYVPQINWGLMVSCLILVVTFQKSTRLAAAYGMAVTGTMTITSLIYFVVATKTWKWSFWRAAPIVGLFLIFDLTFLGACTLKFFKGGYIPVIVGSAFFFMMLTWKIGRSLLAEHIVSRSPPMNDFLRDLDKRLGGRSPGTGVFMASNSQRVPPILFHHAERIRVLPQTVILLTVVTEHVPVVDDGRLATESLGSGFYRVIARQGFMEAPNVPEILQEAMMRLDLAESFKHVTYYVGRETFIASGRGKMGRYSESLFAFLSRNAQPATMYFGIPPDQVVELGTQIDL
jgi:KUP system potassium uptake protein